MKCALQPLCVYMLILYARHGYTNAASSKISKSGKSCKSKSSKSTKSSDRACTSKPTPSPTPSPTPVPTLPLTPLPTSTPSSQPSQEDIQLSFTNETITYVNVLEVPDNDIAELFAIQKGWYEAFYRDKGRRRLDRRRDARDITTEFEFVAQTVTTPESGSPTNEVTYNQVIGFLPSRRRRLVEFNVDDTDEVLDVTNRIFRDQNALDDLASLLRKGVQSFSKLESVFKFKPKSSSKSSKSSKSSRSQGKGSSKSSRRRRILTRN